MSTGVLALITAAAGFTMLGVHGAAAATPQTRYVSTTGDDGSAPVNDCTVKAKPCKTIQHAVDEAAPGDTVSVAGGKYDESVHIRKSLTVEGAGAKGAGRTTVDGDPESGGASIWIDGFDTSEPVAVTLKDLDVSGNQDDDGIFVDSATVTVLDSVASNNIGNGLELSDSTGTTTRSTFSGNGGDGITLTGRIIPSVAAAATQGASTLTASQIVSAGNGFGGISADPGTATVDDSTLAGNGDGGVVLYSGDAAITTSTLDQNVGAGLVLVHANTHATLTKSTVSHTVPFDVQRDVAPSETYGAGVISFDAPVEIVTSTISGNTGAGVLSLGGFVKISNSTISDTQAAGKGSSLSGAGVVVDGSRAAAVGRSLQSRLPGIRPHGVATKSAVKPAAAAAPAAAVAASTTLVGTITAENSGPSCDGNVVDGGYNLASDKTCAFTAAGSVNSGLAKLGALGDNGGLTLTMLLNKGSQAIDVIPAGAANCSDSVSDQRGVARPQPTGGKCDIGAVEVVQHVAPAPTPSASVSAASATADPIAQTGSNVMPLTMTGGLAVVAGLVVLYAAGRIGRRVGRHRAG